MFQHYVISHYTFNEYLENMEKQKRQKQGPINHMHNSKFLFSLFIVLGHIKYRKGNDMYLRHYQQR